MNTTQIIAVGNFLSSYKSDLLYIKNISQLSLDNCDYQFHCNNNKGSFKSFVNEFKVVRNMEEGKTELVLKKVLEYFAKHTEPQVDELVIELRDHTRNQYAVSLASKILFLFKPVDFVPMDFFNKKALGYKGNIYCEFKKEFDTHFFKNENNVELEVINSCCLPLAKVIEEESEFNINFEIIRTNRLKDKLLWAQGKSMP